MTLEALKQVWETNKLRVILVAVPVIVLMLAAIFLKGYRTYLLGAAQRVLTGAKTEDEKLRASQLTAEVKADEAKKLADALGKKAEEIKNGDGDLDWNKKQ